jgi:hypothetical protein
MSYDKGAIGHPPPELMYIVPPTSIPPQPAGCTWLLSSVATTFIGVVVTSTTINPPPRSVTKAYLLDDSVIGQIGAVSGRSPLSIAPRLSTSFSGSKWYLWAA